MKKLIILLLLIGIGLSVTLTTFNNSNSVVTYEFTGAGENLSIGISIPNGSTVSSATLNVSTYQTTGYPQGTTIDIGANGTVDWNQLLGSSTSTNYVSSFTAGGYNYFSVPVQLDRVYNASQMCDDFNAGTVIGWNLGWTSFICGFHTNTDPQNFVFEPEITYAVWPNSDFDIQWNGTYPNNTNVTHFSEDYLAWSSPFETNIVDIIGEPGVDYLYVEQTPLGSGIIFNSTQEDFTTFETGMVYFVNHSTLNWWESVNLKDNNSVDISTALQTYLDKNSCTGNCEIPINVSVESVSSIGGIILEGLNVVYTEPPFSITIHNPTSGGTYLDTAELNVTADTTIQTWWYSLNGGSNVTFTPNTTINLDQGENTLIVYANTSGGTEDSASVTFSTGSGETVVVSAPGLGLIWVLAIFLTAIVIMFVMIRIRD